MVKKDLVLLYSGGLESRYLLHLALQLSLKPFCVLVDYGQKHIAELTTAVSICIQLEIEYEIVKLTIPKVESKLTGNFQTTYEGVSEWYVPSRNLIFVSLAASMAESRGIDTIWYGASYSDRVNIFPDCYQDWVVAVNKVLVKNGSKKIQLVAPLMGMPKELIQELAKIAGIKNEEVFSGYGE